MTPFFGKRCFLTWVKKWVLLTVVFEKLCFPENTIFIVFSAKHSFSKTKTVCWKKNRKFMKNSGLFLNMANGAFWVWFFWGFNIKKVCFWCVWHCFKSVKNACFFPIFWAFLGWLIIVHLGLEGLGVFVFLVFVFLCCVAFVSVLFALLLVLFFVLFFSSFFLFFFFVCFVFCFFWRV